MPNRSFIDYWNEDFAGSSTHRNTDVLKDERIQGQTHFEGEYVVNITQQDQPVKIEANTVEDGVPTIGVQVGTSRFTATRSGVAFLTATIITSGATGETIRVAFYKNGNEVIQSRSILRTSAPGAGDRRQTVPQCLVNLSEGDVIELFFTNLSGTENPTIRNLTIIIKS